MNIQKRLHHRPPYLFLSKVVEHSDHYLHAQVTPHGDEFYLLGHFPHVPIVPGAIMQEMTTQAAGLMISEHHSPVPDYDSETTKGWALGVLRAIHMAKYKNFARPGETLDIKVELLDHIENSFRFRGHIEMMGKKIMTNEFTLINISEEKLMG
jgi:3-hydroxyacyl-[acyl-carrier-protein] dehydratase